MTFTDQWNRVVTVTDDGTTASYEVVGLGSEFLLAFASGTDLAAVMTSINGMGPVVPPPPPVIPSSIAMWQARVLLASMPGNPGPTLLDDANAAIHMASQTARIAWQFASTVSRDSDLLATVAATLNLSAAQLDGMFLTAAGIAM